MLKKLENPEDKKMLKLLSEARANPKLVKSQKHNYMAFPLHLAPYTVSGVGNTCPKATLGCSKACLNMAGQGGMIKKGETTNKVQQARIRKTKMFFENRDEFLLQLVKDIKFAITHATKKNFTPVFRLNATSDIQWVKYKIPGTDKNIFETFPDIQFYDYSKIINKANLEIPNYHITFSRAENNEQDVIQAKGLGMSIAVVFKKLPETYMELPVFDADDSDARFLDPKDHIIGLKAKGPAKKDTSGFVI